MKSTIVNDEIMVSVICNTYNHEKYIKDALDSFIKQVTSFKFEILIHDDASTDSTAKIIKEYELRYPDIIKPIYQSENQYSKGISISKIFQIPRARGKYIAYCEGDDYWIDSNKLQTQVDALEAHSDINICTCKALRIKNGKNKGYISPSNTDVIFSPKQVISGGGGFVSTNSIMVRKNEYVQHELFDKTMSLDFFIQIIGSLPNGMLYLDRCMCAYRMATDGSWSSRMKANPENKIEFVRKINKNLSVLNEITKYTYNDSIKERILKNEVEILILQDDFKKIRREEYRHIFINYSFKYKVKLYLSHILHVFSRRING